MMYTLRLSEVCFIQSSCMLKQKHVDCFDDTCMHACLHTLRSYLDAFRRLWWYILSCITLLTATVSYHEICLMESTCLRLPAYRFRMHTTKCRIYKFTGEGETVLLHEVQQCVYYLCSSLSNSELTLHIGITLSLGTSPDFSQGEQTIVFVPPQDLHVQHDKSSQDQCTAEFDRRKSSPQIYLKWILGMLSW
jgi:hypothetical protein